MDGSVGISAEEDAVDKAFIKEESQELSPDSKRSSAKQKRSTRINTKINNLPYLMNNQKLKTIKLAKKIAQKMYTRLNVFVLL